MRTVTTSYGKNLPGVARVSMVATVASNARFADGSGGMRGHISSSFASWPGRYRPDVVGHWRYCLRFGRFGDVVLVREMGFSVGQCPRGGAGQEGSRSGKE